MPATQNLTTVPESATPSANDFLAERASRIRELVRRTIDDAIEIGRILLDCKKAAGPGNWLNWLEHELRWKASTAEFFMDVFKKSETRPELIAHAKELGIPVSALADLFSAPEIAGQLAEQVKETGKPPTTRQVKATAAAAKGKAPKTSGKPVPIAGKVIAPAGEQRPRNSEEASAQVDKIIAAHEAEQAAQANGHDKQAVDDEAHIAALDRIADTPESPIQAFEAALTTFAISREGVRAKRGKDRISDDRKTITHTWVISLDLPYAE